MCLWIQTLCKLKNLFEIVLCCDLPWLDLNPTCWAASVAQLVWAEPHLEQRHVRLWIQTPSECSSFSSFLFGKCCFRICDRIMLRCVALYFCVSKYSRVHVANTVLSRVHTYHEGSSLVVNWDHHRALLCHSLQYFILSVLDQPVVGHLNCLLHATLVATCTRLHRCFHRGV